jgi:broad specificity phosphatase PhoE
MTTFVLIRHALHRLGPGMIAGRMPAVHLSPAGVEQASRLPQRLARVPLEAIYCSPLERAMETARPLADHRRLDLQTRDDLLEIDFGEWTGTPIDELREGERWVRWNSFRSGQRVPDGESMIEVQSRIVALMLSMRSAHPGGTIALVSHGDVIKAALAWCLGVPLDLFQRIEISTASISVVTVVDDGPWALCVNATDDVGDLPSWEAGR